MPCPSCVDSALPHAPWCSRCGELLGAPPPSRPLSRCARCDHRNPPVARFCSACGAELPGVTFALHGPSAVTAKASTLRREATVLHADLCGFTRRAERMSPEEARGVLQTVFDAFDRIIRSLNGKVEAYVGDAAMAVFGLSGPGEDAPMRALAAAQEIHAELARISRLPPYQDGPPLKMRIGVATGDIVLSQMLGAPGATLVGAPVSEAIRLEQAAPPAETMTSGVTLERTRQSVSVQPVELSDGFVAWRVLRVPPMPRESVAPDQTDAPRTLSFSPVRGTASLPRGATPPPGPLHLAAAEELERLPKEQRRLLQTAALAGPHFWLEALLELNLCQEIALIPRLIADSFLQPVLPSSLAGQLEVRFVDPVLYEAAYRLSGYRVRREMHERMAQWLGARITPASPLVTELARHEAAAGHLLQAAITLIQSLMRAPDALPGLERERRIAAAKTLLQSLPPEVLDASDWKDLVEQFSQRESQLVSREL